MFAWVWAPLGMAQEEEVAQDVVVEETDEPGQNGLLGLFNGKKPENGHRTATDKPSIHNEPVDEMQITGTISGRHIAFDLSFGVNHQTSDQVYDLMRGEAALRSMVTTGSRIIRFDTETRTYRIGWKQKGAYEVKANFEVSAKDLQSKTWREARFEVPVSRVRKLRVICDRTDLAVRFPGALRQTRAIEDDKLVVTALLGPGLPFVVQWKPHVERAVSELVASCRLNAIARVSASSIQLDNHFNFSISQGEMETFRFALPDGVHVLTVEGQNILTWSVEGDGAERQLMVKLNRPQRRQYAMRVVGSSPLKKFPTQATVPIIRPVGKIRTTGRLALGPVGATHVGIDVATGLAQIEPNEFKAAVLFKGQRRDMPLKSKSYYYGFASADWALNLALDDIVPAYDADHKVAIELQEDGLNLTDAVTLTVRDAPLRSMEVTVPKGFVVTDVISKLVSDFRVGEVEGVGSVLRIDFKSPLPPDRQGLINIRMEWQASPLGQTLNVGGLAVRGVTREAGTLVVAADQTVRLDQPVAQNLRQINTASPVVGTRGARFSYRFRDQAWGLTMTAQRQPAGIRAEAFHLVSLGESAIYGSVAVNYYISGAPVDELSFVVPVELGAVEIVGRDVRSVTANQDKTQFTVKLNRKVMGDYNLGLFYNRRYNDNLETLLVGDIECVGVESQTGFVTIASHLNVQLDETTNENLLTIKRQEIPSGYRMLAAAPVLKTYKYVVSPHRAKLAIQPFERGQSLPVVIEVTDLITRVGVDEEDRAESTTRVRYKIKNTSAQHLALQMPEGTQTWSAYLVTSHGRQEKKGAVTATVKEQDKNKLLMIPLPRRRNPNQPITIELVYGQIHGDVGATAVSLVAPLTTLAESTYAGWLVEAEGRAVLPLEGGVMPYEPRDPLVGSLGRVMALVGLAWASGIESFLDSPLLAIMLLFSVGVLLLMFFIRREAVARALVLLVLLMVSMMGLMAVNADGFLEVISENDDLSVIHFAQPLNLDATQPLSVSVAIKTTSMQYASAFQVFGLVLIGFAGVISAWWLKSWKRAAVLSIGAWGWVAAMAQFGVVRWFGADVPIAAGIGHLMTWMIPVAMFLATGLHALARTTWRVGMVPASAMLACVLWMGMAGCATRTHQAMVASDVPDRVNLEMVVEKDNVRLNYDITVHAAEPMKFRLAPTDAILMTAEQPADHVRIFREDGFYWIGVDKAGSHTLNLELLRPLATAGQNLNRSFALPTPTALSGEVKMTIPQTGLQVQAPESIRLDHREEAGKTIVEAVWAPGRDIRFAWQPRLRQVNREKTRFYAETTSIAMFDTASITGVHLVQLQIAQGQVDRLKMKIPSNMIVTQVNGANLGVWNFDPTNGHLEVFLTKPASGKYLLGLMTQINAQKLPWTTTVGALRIEGADRQSGAVGLVANDSVFLEVGKHPRAMNAEDLTQRIRRNQMRVPAEIRNAYHMSEANDQVAVTVRPMKPELHVQQDMLLDVGEERIIYKGHLQVHVAKASVFDLELKMPAAFDIDSLHGKRVRRHWDERVENGIRHVKIYFTGKLTKTVEPIQLSLSRPVSHPIADTFAAPKVEVVGALKRRGLVRVSGIRGLRLSVASQNALSELDPAELSLPPATLVFKVLSPEWNVSIKPELVEPRVAVESVHTAEVSDALVRHVHRLRYQMAHAGVKVFQIQLPKNTLTPSIFGADIVHRKEVVPGSGLWRIELAKKYYGRYKMTVRYETRFDIKSGQVKLEPVVPVGAHRFNGFVVVKTTDRVELLAKEVGEPLQPTEARLIPGYLGAGNVADAAFSYRTNTTAYTLGFEAKRHNAAGLLEAEVESTRITTVVNDRGQSIHRVWMMLNVGAKRHLATSLPKGAEIWTVLVNNRAVLPSRAPTSDAEKESTTRKWLIPLNPAGSGHIKVNVQFTYVLRGGQWSEGRRAFQGPGFDLPLNNVRWVFYLPERFEYKDFEGTLRADRELFEQQKIMGYGVDVYEAQQSQLEQEQKNVAMLLLQQAEKHSKDGDQVRARWAQESAYHYSHTDAALNEDARVRLHSRYLEQGVVGLVTRRGALKQLAGGQETAALDNSKFTKADNDSRLNGLDRADSENLHRITSRIMRAQGQAAGDTMPININLAKRGRVLAFEKALFVEPFGQMEISFRAKQIPAEQKRVGVGASLVLWAVALLALGGFPWFLCKLNRRRVVENTSDETAMDSETESESDVQTLEYDEDETDREVILDLSPDQAEASDAEASWEDDGEAEDSDDVQDKDIGGKD